MTHNIESAAGLRADHQPAATKELLVAQNSTVAQGQKNAREKLRQRD